MSEDKMLKCETCNRMVDKNAMFDWITCQECYDKSKIAQMAEQEKESIEYNTCGKPHNNADEESACIECQIIKQNL